MGRKKIEIKAISDRKSRKDTFHKRKVGLIKKAAELSMLCNIRMLVVFEDLSGEVLKYSTHGIYDPVKYFKDRYNTTPVAFTAQHYPDFFKSDIYKKRLREQDDDDEDEVEEDDDDAEDNRSSEDQYSRPQVRVLQQKRADRALLNMASNEPCHSSIAHSKGKKSSNVLFQKMQHEKFCRAPEHQTIAEAHGKLMREQMLHEEVGLRNYHQSLPNTASEMQIEHQTKCEARAIEEPKRFLVRDVPKPRLKILKDDEETNSSAYLSNKFFSPNLFTASPIPYVGVSPMQMNLKTFLYEFNDNAILNGMHTHTRTKDAHQRGNYAQSKQFHAIPSQSKLHAVGRSQRSDPPIDRRNRSLSRKTDRIDEERDYFEQPVRRVFEYKNFENQANEEDEEMLRTNNQISEFQIKEEENDLLKNELESCGMHMFFPFPLSSIRRNQGNPEWVQYFLKHQLDRPEKDDMRTVLDTSKLSAMDDQDRSLSIAKSPIIVKKVKEN